MQDNNKNNNIQANEKSLRNKLVASILLIAFSIAAMCLPITVSAQPADEKSNTIEDIITKRYERVYVPEKDLAQYWSAVDPGVLLSKKEFGELLKRAQKANALGQGQPLGIVVEQIEYQAVVSGDILKIEAKCMLSKYKPGWARLVLPINNVSITQAKLDGQPAPLGISGKPSQLILIENFTGQRELILSLTTPIRRVGTDEIASFSVFPNTAATLKIDVSKARVLEINGSVLETNQQHQTQRTVTTAIGGKGNIQIRLTDALGESLNESLVFAQTIYSIGVERNTINWQADCQIDLFGKRFNRLEFSVPNHLEIADVSAPGLQDWDLQDDVQDNTQTKISLTFRETIPQQIRVTLQGVQLLEKSDDWAVAPLKLNGVTSNTGGLGISVAQDMRLKTIQMEGIRPSARSWKPAAKFIQPSNLHFYDIWDEDFTFRLSTSQTAREVQAAVTNILDVEETEIQLLSTITLQTLFSPLFELNIELPAQWSPKQIRQQTGEIDWQYTSQQAGVHRLRLPISPPLKPGEKRTIWLTVRLNREGNPKPDEKETIVLPELKLEGVKILEGSFVVRANPRLDVIPVNIEGMDAAYLGIPNERFGYRYQDSRIAGLFEVVRKPTRYNASTTQIVTLDEETISMRYQVMLDIGGGGLRELQVNLASDASIDEEFQALGRMRISDQKRTKTETGTRWNLTFDRYVTGKVPLLLTVILPRDQLNEKSKLTEEKSEPTSKQPQQYAVPELTFDAAELQEQYLAFSARTDQRLTLNVTDKTGTVLEPIDPADLPFMSAQTYKRIVAGYHIIKPGVTALVSEDRFDSQPIPTAIGHKLLLTSLLLEGGQFQQQATLTFAAVGVQSLMVHLPDGMTLWSTTIDGIPVTARKVEGGFVVALTNNQAAGQQRTLQTLYGSNTTEVKLPSFSSPTLPSPTFAVVSGTGTRQPLRILKTVWEIHHSQDSQIQPLDPGVEQINKSKNQTWLSQLIKYISHTNWQRTLQDLLIGSMFLVIPWGLIFLFRSRGWALYPTEPSAKSRWIMPTLLFTLCGIAVLVFLSLPGIQGAREAARRVVDYGEYSPDLAAGTTLSFELAESHSAGESDEMAVAIPQSTGMYEERILGLMPSEEMEELADQEMLSRDSKLSELKRNMDGKPGIATIDELSKGRVPRLSGRIKSESKTEPFARSRPQAGEAINAPDFIQPKDQITHSTRTAIPQNATSPARMAGQRPAPSQANKGLGTDGYHTYGSFIAGDVNGNGKAPAIPNLEKTRARLGERLDQIEQLEFLNQSDGLLSLQLALQIPDHLQVTQLQSFGEQASQAGLKIQYLSQTAINRLRWLIISGVVLLFWLLRNRSRAIRCCWLAVLFGSPIIAMGIVPEIFLPLIEGVLLGGIFGVVIWSAISISHFLQKLFRCCCQVTERLLRTGTTAASLLLLFAIQTNSPCDLQAKEPVAKPQQSQTAPQAAQQALTAPVTPAIPTVKHTVKPATVQKQTLVFPYAADQSPLAAERVFVPEAEYLKLWKVAHPKQSIEAAPVAFLVHEASYVAEVSLPNESSNQHAVVVKARYIIRNFRDEEQLAPLPLGPVIMESVRVNGQKTSSTLVGKNQPAVLLPAAKLSVIDVQFQLPANAVNQAGQFTVSFLPVAAGSFSFLLPEKETQVRINDGKTPYQLITRDDKNFAQVVVAPGGNYTFSWQPKISTTQMQFLSCESAREVFIRDTGAELYYSFAFNIAQGTFSEVELKLPENVKLKSLSGSDLAGWQLLDDGRLRVLLKRAVDDRSVISVSLFVPLDIAAKAQEFQLPDIIPQGVTREIGSWAVTWDTAITARFTTANDVRQVKNDQFKRLIKSAIVINPQRVYNFSSRPFDLRLEVQRKQASSTVQQYTLIDIQQHKTHVATFAKIKIEAEPRLSIDFAVPKNLQIIELTATNLSDWFVTSQNDQQATLTVLFASPQMGLVEVVARGTIQQEAGSHDQASLSGLQMINAKQTTSFLGIGAADILAVSLEAMDGWKSIDPKSLPAALQQMATFPIRLGLTNSTNNPRPVTVSLSRQLAQVKAHSVSLLAVSDTSIDYGVSMQWIISKAATDRFSFIGPKWFENRIEFQSSAIRLVKTDSIDEHRTLWTIETRQPQNSQFFVTAAITLPYPDDRTVSTPKITFVLANEKETEKPSVLEIQGHYAILVNLGKEPLEPISDHARLLVQQKELPIKIPKSLMQQAMEIVRVTNRVVPSWELKKLGKQGAPAATVTLSQLKTVIDAQGSWRTLARYTVKNRRRQFLPVLLPDDAELLSVIVAGKPSKALRKNINKQQAYLIPLPPAGDADLSIEVRIVLQGKLKKSLVSAWGIQKVTLPHPTILSPEASPEFGIPVMYTTWELSTPEDIAIRSSSLSNMNLSNRRHVSQLALKSQLKEISDLSRIVSGKSNSYGRRSQAATNLKKLQESITLSYDDLKSDMDGDGSLQIEQQQVLEEAEVNFNEFTIESAQTQRGEQSAGRSYILLNNAGIGMSNTLQTGNIDPLSGNLGGLPPIIEQAPASRINAPQAQGQQLRGKKSSAKGKEQAAAKQRSLNRKSLLDENLRQNTLFFDVPKQQLTPKPGNYHFKNWTKLDDRFNKNQDGASRPQLPAGGQGGGGGGGFGKSSGGESFSFGLAEKQPASSTTRGQRPHVIQNNTSIDRGAPVSRLTIQARDGGIMQQTIFGETPALVPSDEQATEKWTATGGLSLPIELPGYEQVVVFSKVEGNPVLIVEVHSRNLLNKTLGLIWVVFTSLIVLWLLKNMNRFTNGQQLPKLYVMLILFGLGSFVLLPNPLACLGLIIAVVAAILYTERTTRKTTQPSV